jgi:hypothetical protein
MFMTMGHPLLYVMSGLYLCAVCRGMQQMKDMYSLTAPITRAQSGVNAAYEVTNVPTVQQQACLWFTGHP